MEHFLTNRFAAVLNLNPDCLTFQPVGGGSINQAFRILAAGNELAFFKMNSATKFPHLFEAEAKALKAIAFTQTIRTPAVLDCFEHNTMQYLLLEWIPPGNRTINFWTAFGTQLAQLHAHTAASFGLDHNNYMGAIQQSNTPTHSWIQFFQQQRLQPLLETATTKGLLQSRHLTQFEAIFKKLPDIFGTSVKPSLLHGDLWSGNFICNTSQQPALIDPALYFGHPSMDLAMTTLFGGFHPAFYNAYQQHTPFPPNHLDQWNICNLYPLLIHLLLFGSSYRSSIESILSIYQ